MEPTVGRIVRFTDQQERESAAMVTAVDSERDTVTLAVFSGSPGKVPCYREVDVKFSAKGEPISWHWPDGAR